MNRHAFERNLQEDIYEYKRSKTDEADLKAKQAETGGSIDRYDSEMDQASQKSRQAAQEACHYRLK